MVGDNMEMKQFKATKYVAPKTKKRLVNIFWTILFPLIGIAFFGAAGGFGDLGNSLIRNDLILTMVTVLIACFALNTNLNSGRMDFSLGAVGVLGCVIAWNVIPNKAMPNFAILFLFLSILFGMILGLLSGLLFVTLKIPAIVVSLGVCLIYEGFAYVLSNGEGSIEMPGDIAPDLYPTITNPWFIAIVTIVIAVFMLLALKYSKFGHDKLTLLYGQKVAVDTGVNEIKNALICYTLAGALIAIYTFIVSANLVKIQVSTNLGSAMTVMANFLPIFLGGLIAKHSNEVIGLMLGVFSVTLFKDSLNRFGLTNSNISLITSILIFIILTYMVNWANWVRIIKNKIKNYKLQKFEGKNN